MSKHRNLMTVCFAAVFALGLAACSSSNDDPPAADMTDTDTTDMTDTPTEPTAPEPTPVLTPAEQLTAAQGALVMAQGLVDALTSTSTAEEAAAAYAALGAAQVALHAATNLPANQIAALQAQINQLVLDLAAADSTPSTETVALEQAQADAATAATEAMEAARLAKVASDAAQTAIENNATLQTGAKSGDLAHTAYMQAKAAADAAAEAQTASDAAAEATDGVAATRLLVMAETARNNAVEAQGMAETQSAAAVTATMTELMIDGKDKNVGGTSVNADAASSVVTTVTGTVSETEETGRITAKDPKHEGFGAVTGAAFVPAMPDETPAEAAVPYKQEVAARDLTIGRTLDTSDDMARLMLVTHYAGTKMVRVYNAGMELESGTKAGYITIEVQQTGGETEVVEVDNVALKSEGTYYAAGGASPDEGALEFGDAVEDDAKPKEVFSYKDPTATGDAADEKKYVVATTRVIGDTSTTYHYVNVEVIVPAAVADGDDELDAPDASQVRAALPVAIDYKHIHFGVWAALGAAEASGSQDLSDRGIGFVQGIGDGLTGADMPNNGKAYYSGSWVAAVQAAEEDGNGSILLTSGNASLTADLTMATIEADLMGLATLEGAIDTNTFSGTKATVDEGNTLDPTGKFTGTFSGGFYGDQAAEAGGVFDFTSKGAVAGAFRGAFGGDRDGL